MMMWLYLFLSSAKAAVWGSVGFVELCGRLEVTTTVVMMVVDIPARLALLCNFLHVDCSRATLFLLSTHSLWLVS